MSARVPFSFCLFTASCFGFLVIDSAGSRQLFSTRKKVVNRIVHSTIYGPALYLQQQRTKVETIDTKTSKVLSISQYNIKEPVTRPSSFYDRPSYKLRTKAASNKL